MMLRRSRPGTLKRTPLRKISPLKRSSSFEEKQQQLTSDWEFYQEIWNERPHTCEVTGRYLGEEPLTTFFHHILPKAKYPQYRHSKWNIAVLHPEVHNQYELFPDKVPELVNRQQKLLNMINGIID